MYCVTRGAAAGHNGGGMWAVGAVTCHSNTGLDTASNIGSTRLLGIISWLAHTFPWTFLAFTRHSLTFTGLYCSIPRYKEVLCNLLHHQPVIANLSRIGRFFFPQLNSITNIGEQLRNILEQKHTITQRVFTPGSGDVRSNYNYTRPKLYTV